MRLLQEQGIQIHEHRIRRVRYNSSPVGGIQGNLQCYQVTLSDQPGGDQVIEIYLLACEQIRFGEQVVIKEVGQAHIHSIRIQEVRQRYGCAGKGILLDQPQGHHIRDGDGCGGIERIDIKKLPARQFPQRCHEEIQQSVQYGFLEEITLRIDGAQIQQPFIIQFPDILQVAQVEIVQIEIEVHRQVQGAGHRIIDHVHPLGKDAGVGELLYEILH